MSALPTTRHAAHAFQRSPRCTQQLRPSSVSCIEKRQRRLLHKATLNDSQLVDQDYEPAAPAGPSPPAATSQASEREALMSSYAKYLPKGVSVDEVDWSLLRPSTDSSSEPAMSSRQDRVNQKPHAAQALDTAYTTQLVQWYPGHIAKAERQLKEQLSKVDVVLEVLDARIPVSTTHPQLSKWIGMKPRVLVLNRIDMIPPEDLQQWRAFFRDQQQRELFCTNGQQGRGIAAVKKQLLQVGEAVNAKRAGRGLLARAVRACVVGFPNIGKSALINRLLGKRVVDSAPLPGVTKVLRWVRLGGQVDLLDAPGVIPASFNDQLAAQRLAMCNDIGQAAYEDTLIAAAFVNGVRRLPCISRVAARMAARYKVDPRRPCSAEDYIGEVADRMFLGHRDRAGLRILQDFRSGALGTFSLETPQDWVHPRHY